MKISLTITLTLLFYVSHLFSHPENNSEVLFEKPFINSMEQEKCAEAPPASMHLASRI